LKFFSPPFFIFGSPCRLFFGFFGTFGAVEQAGDFVAGELFAVADVAAHVVYETDVGNGVGQRVGIGGGGRRRQAVFGFEQAFAFIANDKALCDVELGVFDPK